MTKVRIGISRPLREPEWRRRSRSVELNQDRFEAPTAPLTLADLDQEWMVIGRQGGLPLADGSVDRIEIEEVLELVRDDLALFQELVRVLKPGGTLRMRVPNAGPLAGFDSFNLYRYVADIIHRGVTIPEVREVGFRRHYKVSDLENALGPGFKIRRSWTTGTALSEIANLVVLGVTTLVVHAPGRYVAQRPKLQELARFDQRIPMAGIGYWRWIEARRIGQAG